MLTLCLPRIGINKCLRRIYFGDVLSSSIKKASRPSYALQWILSNLSIDWLDPALQTRQSHKFLLWSVGLIPLHHSPAVYHRLDFPKNHHDRQPLGTQYHPVPTLSYWGSSKHVELQIIIPPLRKFHWRQDKLLRTWILEEHLPQKFTSKGTLQTNPGGKRNVSILQCQRDTTVFSNAGDAMKPKTSTSTIIC